MQATSAFLDSTSLTLESGHCGRGSPFRIYGVREGQAELVAEHILQVEIE